MTAAAGVGDVYLIQYLTRLPHLTVIHYLPCHFYLFVYILPNEEEVVVAVANELAASIVELKEEEVRARCFLFDLTFIY